jgi:hypothetical protein
MTNGKDVLGGIVCVVLVVAASLMFRPSPSKPDIAPLTTPNPDTSNFGYDPVTTQKLAEFQARAEASPEYQKNGRAARAAHKQAEAQELTANLSRYLAVAGTKQIKESMKDPDSFQLKSALLVADHSVCYEYSATNSFGGRMREHAVLTPKGKIHFNEAGIWNKSCANKSGDELAALAQ